MSQTPALNPAQGVGSQPSAKGPASKSGGDFATRFLDLLFAEGEPAAAAKRTVPGKQPLERAQEGNRAASGEGEAVTRLPKGGGAADPSPARQEGTGKAGKQASRENPLAVGSAETAEPNLVELTLGGALQPVPRTAAGGAGAARPELGGRGDDTGAETPDGGTRRQVTPERIATILQGGQLAAWSRVSGPAGVDPAVAGASGQATSPAGGEQSGSATTAESISSGERLVAQLARRLWGTEETRAAVRRSAAPDIPGGTGEVTARSSAAAPWSVSPRDSRGTGSPGTRESGHSSRVREGLENLFTKPVTTQQGAQEAASAWSRPEGRGAAKSEPTHDVPAAGSTNTTRPDLPGNRGDAAAPVGFRREAVAMENGQHGSRFLDGRYGSRRSEGRSSADETRAAKPASSIRRPARDPKPSPAQGTGEEVSRSSAPQSRELHAFSTLGGRSGFGSPGHWQPIANQTFRPAGAAGSGGPRGEAPDEIEAVPRGGESRERSGVLRRNRFEGLEPRPGSSHSAPQAVNGQEKSLYQDRTEVPAGGAEGADPTGSPGASTGTRHAASPRFSAVPVLSEALTQQVFQQLVQRVRLDRWPEVEQLTVQLRPELLGKVVIETRQDRGEHLHAVIKVEDPAVKQLFDQRLPELLQKLAESGIHVDSAEVDWLGGGNAGSQDGRRNASSGAKGAELTVEEELQNPDLFAAVAEDGRNSWFA